MIRSSTRWQTGHSSTWPATKLELAAGQPSLTNPSELRRRRAWPHGSISLLALGSAVNLVPRGVFTFELSNLFPKQPCHITLGLVDGADIHA